MKIKIVGSMTFAKDMIQVRDELVKQGVEVIIPSDAMKYASGNPADLQNLEQDIIRTYYNQIQSADAILVLNKDKYDIKNYLGGNALIEMSFAYILGKKIFLLNPIPQMPYTHEIQSMQPFIINGDLSLIRA